MATRLKKGMYGMTRPRVTNILGTVKICDKRLSYMQDIVQPLGTVSIVKRDYIEGEIIAKRNDHMQYLTVQISSEYEGRVYVLNLLYSQCEDIRWR